MAELIRFQESIVGERGVCHRVQDALPMGVGTDVRPRTSIVVPCYNAETFIASSLERLEAYIGTRPEVFGRTELIVVDDGSSDRTAEVVSLKFPGATLVRHTHNRGKGAAVRAGMLAATGSFVFFVDADVPFALPAFERMLDYLDRKDFDVCIGTRPCRHNASGARPRLARRLASAIFTELVSRLVVTGVRDTQCGLKGFRADAARYLFSQSCVDNFAFDVEILYLVFKNDLDLKRVAVRLEANERSSVSLLRHAGPMLAQILMLPLRYRTRRYTLLESRRSESE